MLVVKERIIDAMGLRPAVHCEALSRGIWSSVEKGDLSGAFGAVYGLSISLCQGAHSPKMRAHMYLLVNWALLVLRREIAIAARNDPTNEQYGELMQLRVQMTELTTSLQDDASLKGIRSAQLGNSFAVVNFRRLRFPVPEIILGQHGEAYVISRTSH